MLRLNLCTPKGLCCSAFIQNIVYIHITVPAFVYKQLVQGKTEVSGRFSVVIYTSVFRVPEIHLLGTN